MTILVLVRFRYLRMNFIHRRLGIHLMYQKDGQGAGLTDAMTGAAYAIQSFIPLFVRCDRTDVHVVPQVKAVHTDKPTFFIYDSYPGGIGLSEKIFSSWDVLFRQAANHVSACRCKAGCPVCIGAQEAGMGMKKDVGSLLHTLAGGEPSVL